MGSSYGVDTRGRGRSHDPAGRSWTAQGFIVLFRMANNLNLMNYLLPEFSIQYFGTTADRG